MNQSVVIIAIYRLMVWRYGIEIQVLDNLDWFPVHSIVDHPTTEKSSMTNVGTEIPYGITV